MPYLNLVLGVISEEYAAFNTNTDHRETWKISEVVISVYPSLKLTFLQKQKCVNIIKIIR